MSATWRRIAASAFAAIAASLLAAPGAGADWRTIPGPGGQVSRAVVADADTWLAEAPSVCCTPTYHVTEDQGAHWIPVQIPGYDFAQPAGAAADRSFRVVAWTTGFEEPEEARIFRITSEGGLEPLGPPIETGTTFHNEIADVSEEGVTWVPFQDEKGAHHLALVRDDGSTSIIATPEGPTPADRWRAERTARGMRLLRYASEGGFSNLFARETFRFDGADLIAAEFHPVGYAEGELLIGMDGAASWDGGGHWSTGLNTWPVPVAPGLGMSRYMALGYGIAERFSPYLFRKTGLTWPEGVPTNFAVDAGRALIAWSSTAIHVHEGPLPSAPLAIGELAPDTQTMLSRANLFRADAGLPSLTGHAVVSQASRNHSRYTLLNANLPGPEMGHDELTGRSGYTGFWPGDRCEAVGTHCSGEVMHHPGEEDPVGDWLATPFHRSLVASPLGGIVGGGRVDGGWSVMNSQGEAQNVLVRPFGYPNGRWRGREGFAGEVPDPVRGCKESGHPIEYPVGIAVTLSTPGDSSEGAEVNRIEVRARGSATPLAGCLLRPSDFYGSGATGTFLLDDPLVPGQTYDARGEWTAPADWRLDGSAPPGPTLSHDWTFTFQPDGYGRRAAVKRCRGVSVRTSKSSAKVWRRPRPGFRKGLQVSLTLTQAAKVRLRSGWLSLPGKGKRRKARLPLGKLRAKDRSLRKRSLLTFHLPRRLSRDLPVGEKVSLRIVFEAQRRSGCTRRVKRSRGLRATVGWVKLKGLAAWRSAKAKKRPRGARRR